MPIVLIIVGLAVAIGIGSYFLRPADVVEQPLVTVPVEDNNDSIAMPNTSDTESGNDTTMTPSGDTNQPAVDTPTTPVATTPNNPTTPDTNPTTPTNNAPTTVYSNGAHTITTSYNAPGSNTHTLTATLTLKNDVVTGSSVTFGGDRDGESAQYQKRFLGSYESQVIGKKLADIKLSRVAGASLTTNSFNDAIAKVKAAAKN